MKFWRSLALFTVFAGLIVTLDLPGLHFTSFAQKKRPVRKQTGTSEVTTTEAVYPAARADDCSYLKDPVSHREATSRHRTRVSASTDQIAQRIYEQAAQLAQAESITRNNFIDVILFNRMERDGVLSAPVATDVEFVRRIYLDLTGRIPAPTDVTNFLSDTNPNKRNVLIDTLLNSPEFVDKWTMFYNDLFRNTSFSTNINRYRGGREAFYTWIRNSIASNKSYDQMATEMIAANGDSFVNGEVNFIVGGHIPMGPAQDIYDGYAVQVSTTFLGLSSMDCLLCHSGAGHLDAVNLWGAQRSRAEAWGMAAFFARARRQQVQVSASPQYFKHIITEATTGEYQLNTNSGNRQTRAPINGNSNVAPRYILSGAGASASENRRQAVARHIVADPQFARTAVNYIWEELMIEGLVSPSNTFDPARLDPNAQMPEGWSLQPANAELLEALAQDFKNNGYSIRSTIANIVKSNAYQLSSRYPGTWRLDLVPYYARKFVRRLSAEEVHDAVVKATGLPPATTFNSVVYRGFPITDDANAYLRTVEWAMQLPEPNEPRTNGVSAGFLNAFLRGNRDSNLRSADASILQALSLMNNSFVMGRIHQGNRITNLPGVTEIPSTVRRLLADTALTNEQLITQLYLHTLSRNPTDAEKTKLLTYYTSMGRQAATESLQWVLLNKVDFIFNY